MCAIKIIRGKSAIKREDDVTSAIEAQFPHEHSLVNTCSAKCANIPDTSLSEMTSA